MKWATRFTSKKYKIELVKFYGFFSETIHKFQQRAQEQTKGPAPHKEVAMADEEFYKKTEENAESAPEDAACKATQQRLPRMVRSRSTDPSTRVTFYDTGHAATYHKEGDLHPILQRIESRIFNVRPRAFHVFKNFDVDKDGKVFSRQFAYQVYY